MTLHLGRAITFVMLPAMLSVACGGAAGPSRSVSRPAGTTSVPPAPFTSSAFFNGHTGAVETFALRTGAYSIETYAQYDPTYDPAGSGRCFFSGELDNLTTGAHAPLGSRAPIVDGVPLARTVSGSLDAGTYKLDIYPVTNCDWRFTILPASSG